MIFKLCHCRGCILASREDQELGLEVGKAYGIRLEVVVYVACGPGCWETFWVRLLPKCMALTVFRRSLVLQVESPDSISITWQLVGNADSQTYPRATGSETLGLGLSHLCFNKSSR